MKFDEIVNYKTNSGIKIFPLICIALMCFLVAILIGFAFKAIISAMVIGTYVVLSKKAKKEEKTFSGIVLLLLLAVILAAIWLPSMFHLL